MYKLCKDKDGQICAILRTTDGASIPTVADNTDYQAFLKFLADGGQPLPADDNGQTS
jgi:hypothetical protein